MTMNKTSLSQLKSSGFTLLELLVVISIIGILVAMGAAAYSTAQKTGRDARRQSDLKAYQSAQEQYYAEHTSAYALNQAALTSGGYLLQNLADPKSPNMAYAFPGHTGSAYCACAQMESAKGNSSSNSNCTSFVSGGAYFCVKNLQ